MRGCWLGLSSRHTRTDLLHAALLGVACAGRQALDALVAIQLVAAVGALRLAGGHGICTLAPVSGRAGRHHDSRRPTRRSGTTVRSLIFRRRSHERDQRRDRRPRPRLVDAGLLRINVTGTFQLSSGRRKQVPRQVIITPLSGG